ncbi:hypothetical protein [Sphingomonas sp. Leaf339]|uniref:hypothetical protein n=1 Tax=Sphingomonas sp. Leaf339 TaxID=1736343 RepID=UPI000AC82D5C|nr:hypothetical protein [Sphingomonas sp. Leaf339]
MLNVIKWATIIVIAGGLGLSVLHAMPPPQAAEALPQDTPPIVVIGPDADIVITGSKPQLRGGLWRFRRSPTLVYGGGSIRGFAFTTCLEDGALEQSLHKLAGDQSALPRGMICTRLKLKIEDGKIAGRRSCTTPSTMIGMDAINSRLDLSGRYNSKILNMNYLSESWGGSIDRGGGSGWNPARQSAQRWRVEATRIAECPVQRRLDQRTLEEAITRLFSANVNPDND